MALTIIFFAIVAVIIFIGIKRNVNFGLLGIIAALGIAILVKGESATQVITESFPADSVLQPVHYYVVLRICKRVWRDARCCAANRVQIPESQRAASLRRLCSDDCGIRNGTWRDVHSDYRIGAGILPGDAGGISSDPCFPGGMVGNHGWRGDAVDV